MLWVCLPSHSWRLSPHGHVGLPDDELVRGDGRRGEVHWYHGDERGSAIASSRDSGANSWIVAYDEYGKRSSTGGYRFGFTGQIFLINHLYDFKNRNYMAGLGRFLQPDPIGYDDGMNMYAYVKGDPVNFVDPSGLQTDVPKGCEGADVCGRRTTRNELERLMEQLRLRQDVDGGTITVTGRRKRGSDPNSHTLDDLDFDYPIDVTVTLPDECSGSVRAEGVNLTGILGLGVTASFGRVTVNDSGAISWFITGGLGAGLDAEISGFVTRYDSLSSFQGYAESYSGSIPLLGRTVGYGRSYDVNGNHTGDTLLGSGFPGLPGVRAGASGTATDTTLVGGQCGPH